MKQPIDSRIHGFLDYLTGASLIAASRLPALRGRFAGRALLAAGANHLGYSLLTDYELGAVKKIPYKVHLALDAGGVAGLAAAGATRDDALDRWAPIGVAVYELGALLLSDPNGQRRKPRNAVTVNRSEADVRAFLGDEANVRRFARSSSDWSGDYELRQAPGGRGTEIVADADGNDLRRAKQLLEAGELATAEGPAGRRGVLSSVLPTRDTGANGS